MTYSPNSPIISIVTEVALTNGSTFTSDWIPRTKTGMIMSGASDQDFTFKAEFSINETDVDSSLSYTFDASGINPPRKLEIAREYYRVVIENDSGSDMTYLRFQVSEGDFDSLTFRLNAQPDIDADAALSLAVQSGRNPDGAFELQKISGRVSAGSTLTPLGIGGVFDSGIIDLTTYQAISSVLKSDVDGTLEGTWYNDLAGTQLIRTFTAPYTASAGEVVQGTFKIADYFRLVYTNGSTAQTSFNINLEAFNSAIGGQVSSIEAFIPNNVVAPITRSVLVGKSEDGSYNNVQVNDVGALNISGFLLDVARGRYPTYKSGSKFGKNNDVDTGGVIPKESVWNGGGIYTGFPSTTETVNVSSDSASDTSAGIGARTVFIDGLDGDFNRVTETIIMNGTSSVTSVNSYRRLSRAYVLTAGTSLSNVGEITIEQSLSGAIFAVMPIGGQTAIAADTVEAGKTRYLLNLYATMGRASGAAGQATIALRIKPAENNGAWRSIKRINVTSAIDYNKDVEAAISIPEKYDMEFVVEDVSDNNTIVTSEFEYIDIDN